MEALFFNYDEATYVPCLVFVLAGEMLSIFRSLLISARSLKSSSEFSSSLEVFTKLVVLALIMLISRFGKPLAFLTLIVSGESSEFILM